MTFSVSTSTAALPILLSQSDVVLEWRETIQKLYNSLLVEQVGARLNKIE
jgi:hypothetical protein